MRRDDSDVPDRSTPGMPAGPAGRFDRTAARISSRDAEDRLFEPLRLPFLG